MLAVRSSLLVLGSSVLALTCAHLWVLLRTAAHRRAFICASCFADGRRPVRAGRPVCALRTDLRIARCAASASVSQCVLRRLGARPHVCVLRLVEARTCVLR